ncbi:MAG: hypothetical protein IPP90_23400 [Gemmatimonadaceae bacterium]|nr:hypothetical protein [Gemmatimonadaceae bacterium]
MLATGCTGTQRATPVADSVRPADTVAQSVEVPHVDSSDPSRARPTPSRAPATPADTARGVIRRIGADPGSRLVLYSTANSAPLALSGDQQAELAAAEGLEVTVRGTRVNERALDAAPGGAIVFRVHEFSVRAADGVEARDGILVDVGGRVFLETASGSRSAVIALPTALRDKMGARVFLVGSPKRAPQAFGVLRQP